MIYFDNSATTLQKPPEVAQAAAWAVDHLGNAGRSFYGAAMDAGREIYRTRTELAALIELDDPLRVALTSSATESLNLVIGGLVKQEDRVLTTVTEHNSVLRPLYLRGCALDFIGCDGKGVLELDSAESILRPETKFVIVSHGSNVTGNVTDVGRLRGLCREHGLTLILDISQTFGHIPVRADMADVLCFTGHKGLFGPQGTGGIIAAGGLPFEIVKTGGAGVNSFDRFQQKVMPDVFEAGTLNGPGLYGLQKGVQFVRRTGVGAIHEKDMCLTRLFMEGLGGIAGIRIYGDSSARDRLPVVSLAVDGLSSADTASLLWEKYGIATRAGSHCAPLLHHRFGTETEGLVRFSFSWFNTEEEIYAGLEALSDIAEKRRL